MLNEFRNKRLRLRQAWKKYSHLWHRMEAPAKSILLKEGDISRKVYVIEKGCIRVWFNHQGKEISFQFFFEGDVVCSVESFRKGVASRYSIETIEPSVVRWINKSDLDTVIREDDLLNSHQMDWAVERQAEFIQHFFSFLKDNPQQRYKDLLQQKPRIIQRVPLQYIASYLGITPVSLSRIRNKI
jgi:CRP-like cAMP-binding protein